jgi:uncharacterized membrane protein
VSTRLRLVVVAVLVLAVLAVAALAGKVLWDRAHRSALEKALGHLPADTERVSWTDWAAVRKALHVRTSTSQEPSAVADWLERSYDKDLSAASSIDDSAEAMQRSYGFSPGNADWEAYTQAEAGAAMVLRPVSGVGFDELADRLRALGYRAPSSDTGVWSGGSDLVTSIDPSLTPEVQYVVLLADQHLVVTSDSASYVATAAKAARGDAKTLADVSSVVDMVGHVPEPAAAVVWTRDFACSDLAMSQADQDARDQARQLVTEAGRVDPLSGLVMALSPERTLTVAEQFDSGRQARDNLGARAKLAVGPEVGRSDANFADDFRLTSSRTRGSTVLLTLRPRTGNDFPLSSIYDGPVVFATC